MPPPARQNVPRAGVSDKLTVPGNDSVAKAGSLRGSIRVTGKFYRNSSFSEPSGRRGRRPVATGHGAGASA